MCAVQVLYENAINGILADEMGLGKTVQCIAMVAHLVEQNIMGPFLVCGPLSTVPNWVAEFKRFAPKVVGVGWAHQLQLLLSWGFLRHFFTS